VYSCPVTLLFIWPDFLLAFSNSIWPNDFDIPFDMICFLFIQSARWLILSVLILFDRSTKYFVHVLLPRNRERGIIHSKNSSNGSIDSLKRFFKRPEWSWFERANYNNDGKKKKKRNIFQYSWISGKIWSWFPRKRKVHWIRGRKKEIEIDK